MRKIVLTTLLLSFEQITWEKVNDELIKLGKAYRQFMFRNNPPENALGSLDKYDNTELAFAADFVQETIRPSSDVLSDKFLNRPPDKDLKQIYIVRQINLNVRKENPIDNNQLI